MYMFKNSRELRCKICICFKTYLFGIYLLFLKNIILLSFNIIFWFILDNITLPLLPTGTFILYVYNNVIFKLLLFLLFIYDEFDAHT